jgi:hypothetical protein
MRITFCVLLLAYYHAPAQAQKQEQIQLANEYALKGDKKRRSSCIATSRVMPTTST